MNILQIVFNSLNISWILVCGFQKKREELSLLTWKFCKLWFVFPWRGGSYSGLLSLMSYTSYISTFLPWELLLQFKSPRCILKNLKLNQKASSFFSIPPNQISRIVACTAWSMRATLIICHDFVWSFAMFTIFEMEEWDVYLSAPQLF